jgi:hypothetical protein
MPTFAEWNEQDVLDDAVLVTIWQHAGRTMADIACTRCQLAQDYLVADFPRPVSVALRRAEEVRQACNLSKILVKLGEGVTWQAEWGRVHAIDPSPSATAGAPEFQYAHKGSTAGESPPSH